MSTLAVIVFSVATSWMGYARLNAPQAVVAPAPSATPTPTPAPPLPPGTRVVIGKTASIYSARDEFNSITVYAKGAWSCDVPLDQWLLATVGKPFACKWDNSVCDEK